MCNYKISVRTTLYRMQACLDKYHFTILLKTYLLYHKCFKLAVNNNSLWIHNCNKTNEYCFTQHLVTTVWACHSRWNNFCGLKHGQGFLSLLQNVSTYIEFPSCNWFLQTAKIRNIFNYIQCNSWRAWAHKISLDTCTI